MPNLTVSGNVDTMLGAADNAAIRSAIGVGQTDAPTFLAQTLTGQSLTGTQATSLVDLATTWLSTTGNPTAIKLNVTNTGSGASSNLMDLQIDGISKVRTSKGAELKLASGGSFALTQNGSGITGNRCILLYDAGIPTIATGGRIAWSASAIDAGGGIDTYLERDAAGILAQRNGTNAQAFRVYDSYTDASNFCRANLSFNSNRFELSISSLGTGSTTRGFDIGTNGTGDITFFTSGSNKWRIAGTTGHLIATSDNAFDIGASGANRPRDIYAGGNGVFGGLVSAANGFRAPSSSQIIASSDGIWRLTNSSVNDFNRLQFGSTTDAFPAIARDGAGIKFTGAAAGSTSWIKVPAVAVASLPAAATAGVGARSFVNDALTPVFGSAVTGGGAVTVPVYSTGSAWNVG